MKQVIINQVAHDYDAGSISYEKIVELAGEWGTPTMVCVWRQGGCTLLPGQWISLVDSWRKNLRFECIHTGNA